MCSQHDAKRPAMISSTQINSDIDLNTLPFVSFYKGCLEKDNRARVFNKPLLRWWLRLQVGPQGLAGGGQFGMKRKAWLCMRQALCPHYDSHSCRLLTAYDHQDAAV